MEERIVKLEKQLAFQEHTISELSETVVAQSQSMKSLQKEVDILKSKMPLVSQIDSERTVEDDKPPHY